VPLAQRSEALGDRIDRGDVELAAKPNTRPRGLARHKNFQGWLLSVQRALISPGKRNRTRQRPAQVAVASRGGERSRSTNNRTPMRHKSKLVS
jgi:hypothetical protein